MDAIHTDHAIFRPWACWSAHRGGGGGGRDLDPDMCSWMLIVDIHTNHRTPLQLGLVDDRERHSEALGRTALFKGSSLITALPAHLTVQVGGESHKP